jgi:hypothetical protein
LLSAQDPSGTEGRASHRARQYIALAINDVHMGRRAVHPGTNPLTSLRISQEEGRVVYTCTWETYIHLLRFGQSVHKFVNNVHKFV